MKKPQYICLECSETFSNPRKYIEYHGLETPPYEKSTVCPFCGGSYGRAIWCDGCCEVIMGDYVKVKREDKCYCDACYTIKNIADL